MTHYNPTHLRRLFNVRSERLMRAIFGEHFRVWIAIQIRAFQGRITPEQMTVLYQRWVAMHRQQLNAPDEAAAPAVFMV
jgi:hypothetical protein